MGRVKIDYTKISEEFLWQFSTESIKPLYQIATIPKSIQIHVTKETLSHLPEYTVGNKIRKQRLLKNVNKKDLAKYIGASPGTIDTYEFNKSFPSPIKIMKIAEYLNVPLKYFCDDYYDFIFNNYSRKIKSCRESQGLSLKEASKIIGIYERTLKDWESGNKYPDRIKYKKLVNLIKLR